MGDGFWCFMCLYIRFINGECIRSSFLSWVVRKMLTYMQLLCCVKLFAMYITFTQLLYVPGS